MKKLSDEALDVLSSGIAIEDASVRILRPLDRKLYVEVNAALESLGGTWNRKAKAHLFEENPADALDQVLVDGAWSDRKRDFEQFFTPPALAKIVVERADVKGHIVLEPSAGEGALAVECLRQGAKHVTCIEKDKAVHDRLAGRLDVMLRAAPCGTTNTECADFTRILADVGACTRIVMNPPFSRQQDIEHVTHALGCLKRGGLLVSIMSAGVTFRNDKKALAFRTLVAERGGKIEKLPEGSFKDSGTGVNTVLVVIPRKT